MIFQHARFQIWNANQHPYRHSLDEFLYSNPSLPGVTSVAAALNYLAAAIYPQAKPAVANVAALPLVGNTINDYRIVNDNGDGKSAAYRWEQREGEASASWHLVGDLDFGVDSIVQQFYLNTIDRYVMKWGYDDLDGTSSPYAGDLAGQRIYGGKTAGSHLILYANSGDGVGPGTGFIQFGDSARPLTDNSRDLGSASYRFKDYFGYTSSLGTLLLASGSITDSSGLISFGDEDLSTSGDLTVGSFVFNSTTNRLTNTSGTINLDNENLTTTGSGTFDSVSALGAASAFLAGTQIADFTFTNGNVASSSATVSFNALNLTTTGIGTFGRIDVDSLRLDSNELSVTALNTSLSLVANGTGKILLGSDTELDNKNLTLLNGGDLTVTDGFVQVSGTGAYLSVDNITIDGNTISSSNVNGDINIDPNGSGLIQLFSGFFPDTDSSYDIGKTGNVWNKLWIDGSIGGATEITIADLLTLRSVTFRDGARTLPAQAGDSLFYDGSQWLASAPDTEITHGSISGLLADDHTQYALLAGRAGGQSLIGGTAAAEHLNLESTANASKGAIQFKDNLRPFTDASYSGSWSGTDIGGSSNYIRHLYSKGEFFGLRLENVGVTPSSSAQNVGRLIYNTADQDVYVDTGTTFKRITINRYEEDTVWNGSDTTKNVTVSDVDATKAIWQLKHNTQDFEPIYCSIRATSSTNVLITVGTALPAGSYRLIGME